MSPQVVEAIRAVAETLVVTQVVAAAPADDRKKIKESVCDNAERLLYAM